MKTIEIHEAQKSGNAIVTSYTIVDGRTYTDINNVAISYSALLEYVKENELNFMYINAPDELTEVDAETYLAEYLSSVIEQYLEESHND